MTTQTPSAADEILFLLASEYDAPEDITAATEFESLGFDSLVLVELAVVLSQRYTTEVTDEELQEAGSVDGALRLLRSKGIDV
ncbi:acyl carrier protein [Streptomyces sp. 846.5]|nr:phosphopantetheine-binding protein [Streptomyces sp. 846.5]TDU04078.1 acyl carrier protein [Streptomyces sp. 846.5]